MGRADNYSLLVLAGGKSSRMGTNKAELLYEGRTFLENLIEKVKKLGIEKIYLSGYQKDGANLQVVYDIYPEIGPLGGIHAGLMAVKTPYCMVLPVDVPQIPEDFLEGLLKFHEQDVINKEKPVLAEREGFVEPLIGIYPVSMVSYIEERIAAQRLSVFRMIQEWGCVAFKTDISEEKIANINTREDYDKLLK